uniref:Uncharacterized protein n=1 Tax=Vespula pensylvanica TaxID=30213 RepID=A0A834NYB2_VESPE|nr:hypothetical protein H0235_009342 [Vespula pensylvanica]
MFPDGVREKGPLKLNERQLHSAELSEIPGKRVVCTEAIREIGFWNEYEGCICIPLSPVRATSNENALLPGENILKRESLYNTWAVITASDRTAVPPSCGMAEEQLEAASENHEKASIQKRLLRSPRENHQFLAKLRKRVE